MWQNEFVEQYPKLFKLRKTIQGNGETRMPYCGFSCGIGWKPLLTELCDKLNNFDLPENFNIGQIKEKFGGLRFYLSCAVSQDIQKLIEEYEHKSFYICEKCGDSGILRNGCWIRTLCDSCSENAEPLTGFYADRVYKNDK